MVISLLFAIAGVVLLLDRFEKLPESPATRRRRRRRVRKPKPQRSAEPEPETE
jgi:hypothetical protein